MRMFVIGRLECNPAPFEPMLMESAREYRTLRAPSGDGQTLVDPSWQALPDTVARNREQLSYVQYDVQGRSLADLSAAAQTRACWQSRWRTRASIARCPSGGGTSRRLSDVPFILSGHQPEMFHPGVWYKNFVLGSLARKLDGVGIHLLIDSDTCRECVDSRADGVG